MSIPGTSLVQPGYSAHNTDGIFDDLRAIQREFGYLPAAKLQAVAEARSMQLREVHAVASFYPHFYLAPPARVEVRVCADMSCHLQGAATVLQGDPEGRRRLISLTIREWPCIGSSFQ